MERWRDGLRLHVFTRVSSEVSFICPETSFPKMRIAHHGYRGMMQKMPNSCNEKRTTNYDAH